MRDRFRREIAVSLAFCFLLALLAVVNPRFFSADQIRATLVSSASKLVLALGMALVMLTRQIDISVGSQFSICAIVAGTLAQLGFPFPVVAAVTLAAGLALGAFNGALVVRLGLPSIVATLATMALFREAVLWQRQGEFIRNLSPSFQWFGLDQTAGQWTVVGVALAIFLVLAWSLNNLAAGRAIYAVGSDHEAARLAGLRPDVVTFRVFAGMGALVAVAALLYAVRFPDIDPNAGAGLELGAIAACVVGGIAIAGGRGRLLGVLLGTLLLTFLEPALVFLSNKAQWDKAIQGMIILAAVASDTSRRRSDP